MSELTPVLRQRFFDSNGDPLAGGLLYSYVAGSATPVATFTDFGAGTPNPNPVVLDVNGEANVWIIGGLYKFVLADSDDVIQWTVDNVQSLSAQIATQINAAGALAVSSNLSDLLSVPASLVNLGIAPFSYQRVYAILNGQAATNLVGETFNGLVHTSRIYEYEITQGLTIQATGSFSVHYKNGTWEMADGMGRGDAHGITFSLSQATTIGQLMAEESGLGNATVKLKAHYFFA